MTPPRRGARGFTLVELLVALLVASLFIIGMLQILDTSSRLSKTESALSDTQENVRYGAYSVMRAARMTGGAGLEFSTTDGVWIAAQVLNNQTGTISVDLNSRSITVAPSSDVLILRGFFEQPPFFTAPSNVTSTQVTIQENPSPTFVQRNDFSNLQAAPATGVLKNRLLLFRGQLRDAGKQGSWWIGSITSTGGTLANSGGSEGTVLTLPFAGAGAFDALNASTFTGTTKTAPNFDVYRVAVLESYVFYVNPDMELVRLRNNLGTATSQVLAINVGNLQLGTGIDTDSDGEVDQWLSAPTAAALATNPPIAFRITLLGRTPQPVLDWREPAGTFAVEDLPLAAVDRNAKWRRMQVVATLRNFVL